VTMRELDQYAAMKAELDELREYIKRLESGVVHDRVQGSMDEHPYTLRTFDVEGIAPKNVDKVQGLRNMLMAKEYELSAALWTIEEWMRSVKDSQVRRAIRLKFIEGWTWPKVSRRVYGSPSECTARSAVRRYVEKE